MAIITTIVDALRKFGRPTQKSAIERQDEQLQGQEVIERWRETARSELGQAEQFVARVESPPEIVAVLSGPELAPILENAALMEDFSMAFLGRGLGSGMAALENMDDAFASWLESAEKGGYSSEAVVEIAGAAFGQFCVETLDMRWVRIVDADGPAIAIQGRAKDFRAFPYHAISKRVAARECGFFGAIYISLQHAARQDWAAPRVTEQTR